MPPGGPPAFGPPLICADCGINTSHQNGIGEYYMVQNELWMSVMNPDGFLCIGCLENRLGRRLRRQDFQDMALSDHPHPGSSERLLDRLRSPKA